MSGIGDRKIFSRVAVYSLQPESPKKEVSSWRIVEYKCNKERIRSLKVVGNEKVGGSGMCQIVPIWLGPRRSRFVSLSILPSSLIMYFRFHPSKVKWIGDVPTNRQNAANYLQRFFFWSYFVYLPKCCGSGSSPQHCPPLHIWIDAPILKTERYSLRHYTHATTHLAPLGNAQQYCSVFNFQLVFRGLFLQLAARCLRTQTDSVRL
jgi:hypothetical protein